MTNRRFLYIITATLCFATVGAWAADSSTLYCQVAGNSALSFDGVDDSVFLGNPPSLRLSGDMAVMAWVKLRENNSGLYMGIAGKMVSGPLGYSLVRYSSNQFRFWMARSTGYSAVDSAQFYTDSEWHHVAGVLQAGTAYLYVDGLQQSQGSPGMSGVTDSGDNAVIGRQYWDRTDRNFAGLIDEVRFYNRALNPAEVFVAMSSVPSGSDPDLAGYWPFNEGQGQVAYDMSGHDNHGILGTHMGTEDPDPVWIASSTNCGGASAGTYYVGPAGSDQNNGLFPQSAFATIQRGINAASDGDTVIVADGVYMGQGNKDLDFGGRLITVTSASGPDNTVINCQGNGRGFVFQSGEGSNAVVDGFTIINGNMDRAGGIYCYTSSPTIMNCKITNNNGQQAGGVYCHEGADAVFLNCRITNNTGAYTGGIRIVRCNTQLINCVIANNIGSEAGGGIRCDYGPGSPVIRNCTIAGNSTTKYGGGLWAGYGSLILVQNSILWGNTAAQQGDNASVSSQSSLTFQYCDVGGGQSGIYSINGQISWGNGNINKDPYFANAAQGNYYLKSQRGRYVPQQDIWITDTQTSPCIDAGNPLDDFSEEPEPNGSRINMGAYGGTDHASLSPESCAGTIPGDVNQDGVIDMTDLFLLIDTWLSLYGNMTTAQ